MRFATRTLLTSTFLLIASALLLLLLLLLLLPARASGQTSAFPVDTSTVVLYTFDGTDPDTTFDISGNGLHAFNDGTTSVPGWYGNARLFDGEDDRIDMVTVRIALQEATAWTIEYLAQSENGSQVPELINHTCRNGWWLGPRSGTSRYGIKTTTGGSCFWTASEFLDGLLDLEWHYYALTWGGGTLSYYRDGELRDSTPAGGTFQGGGGRSAWIGHSDSSNPAYFSGLADELRVSNSARTAEEICTTANDLGWSCTVTADEPSPEEPAKTLSMPSPNPARYMTSLVLRVAESQHVTVEVFDALGRRVETLHDGALPAGTAKMLTLDASALPAGVYLIRTTAGGFRQTRSVTLLK